MTATAKWNWPATDVGAVRDGSRIEWAGRMRAMVYFGPGRFEVIDDRPIVCTEHDVLARVERVHRCGTDVKIFASGRPDQCEESLFDELRAIFGLTARQRDGHFADYVRLLLDGERVEPADDALLAAVAARVNRLSPDERAQLAAGLRHHWGRILGHETVVAVERVGSKVRELRHGIGYWQGRRLRDADLDFRPGQRCVLQSRIAYYQPPPTDGPDVAGVQLLGGNITDLAMNLAGAYAQYVRLTPAIVCSGSVLRIPSGVGEAEAALAEPTACLLDCFQKTAHELGQDARGAILHKGVMPGGTVCVIGSGAMALMAGLMALVDDETVGMRAAAEVVFVVRGEDKAALVSRVLNDPRVTTIVCADEAALPARMAEAYAPRYRARTGGEFRGFDDVILAAGSASTVALAHRLIAPTGARIMTFAGTRGPCTVESGVWHYANAGVLGTSGCNTKMMEISLGLFQRGRLSVERLAGRRYTFDDLATPAGVRAFFEDKHLRPYVSPNE